MRFFRGWLFLFCFYHQPTCKCGCEAADTGDTVVVVIVRVYGLPVPGPWVFSVSVVNLAAVHKRDWKLAHHSCDRDWVIHANFPFELTADSSEIVWNEYIGFMVDIFRNLNRKATESSFIEQLETTALLRTTHHTFLSVLYSFRRVK